MENSLNAEICSWRDWEALIGLLTPEFVLDAHGNLGLVYELIRRTYNLILKIKFVIYVYYFLVLSF